MRMNFPLKILCRNIKFLFVILFLKSIWKIQSDFDEISKFKQPHNSHNSLQAWTDSDEEIIEKIEPVVKKTRKKCALHKKISTIVPGVNLQSPKKNKNFKLFRSNIKESKTWLTTNCQNLWWNKKVSNCLVDSTFDIANYAMLWNKFISEKSNNLIKYETITTESEYCLLREILWMFMLPKNYKFFVLINENILVRQNVTIPSVTVNGLKIFLQDNFLPYMMQQYKLIKFIKSIYQSNDKRIPKTYECYAACLKEILQPFHNRILYFENIIKEQRPATIYTIIQLKSEMMVDLEYLNSIYKIHQDVILDYEKYPPHITAAYLLAALIQNFHVCHTKEMANLCITIFISCLPVFFNIIDILWTIGTLQDTENEFLIEKISVDNVSLRPYEKSKELSFFVPSNISKIILNDSFLKTLIEHSLEAGRTLNLLSKINKMTNLRTTIDFEKNLNEAFLNNVFSSVSKFKISSNDENDELSIDNDGNCSLKSSISKYSKYKLLLNECEESDDFLAMAFKSSINLYDIDSDDEKSNSFKNFHKEEGYEPLIILEQLNKSSIIALPLEEIIIQSISSILKNRVAIANSFVTNMYLNDFKILKNLQNIRRVLLLESSDILHPFYTKIFTDIENGKNWANSFALSVQLDDIMSSAFPDVSSLFRIGIALTFKCDSIKVVDAVDEISIFYNVRNEIQNIITEESIQNYNKIFRFLLKIKWALWALESLRFPKNHRNRISYSTLTLLDLEMRRLEQLRFWMIYAIQCLHFHLMTHVLHSMSVKLDSKIKNAPNLSEMNSVHLSYINKICELCFIVNDSSEIKTGIEHIINLIFVLRIEWNSCVTEIENGLVNISCDSLTNVSDSIYNRTTQIDNVEKTYIRCHQFLAKALNNEVYLNQNSFLTGLSAAFNTSIPY